MANILGQVFQDYVHKQVDIRQQKLGGINKDINTLQAYNSKAPFIRLISSVDLLSPPNRVVPSEVDPVTGETLEFPNSPFLPEEEVQLPYLPGQQPEEEGPELETGEFDPPLQIPTFEEAFPNLPVPTSDPDPGFDPLNFDDAPGFGFSDPSSGLGSQAEINEGFERDLADEAAAAFEASLRQDALDRAEAKARAAYAEKENLNALIASNNLEKLISAGIPRELIAGDQLAKNFILQGGAMKYTEIITPAEGTTPERKFDKFTPNSGLNRGTVFDGAYGWGGIDERGYVPMPGITSVQTKYYNNGALSQATINIKCYSKKQFALVDVLYLRPGFTVLLEFGHTVYLDNDGNKQLFEEFLTLPALATLRGDINQFDLSILIEAERARRAGNYEAVYGKISKFNWTFNKDGSYDCTLNVIGLGSVIESLRINTGPSKAVISQYFSNVSEGRKMSVSKSFLHLFLNYILVKGKIKQDNSVEVAEERRTASAIENSNSTVFQAFEGAVLQGIDFIAGTNTFEDVFAGDGPRSIGGYLGITGGEYRQSYEIDNSLDTYLQQQNDFDVLDATIIDVDVNGDGTRGPLIIPRSIVSILNITSDIEEEEGAPPQVYLKFGALISLIQHKLLVYSKDNNIPICRFDMNAGDSDAPLQTDENYIFTFPGHFSSNPLVCIIPYTNLPDLPFYPNIPNFNINNKFKKCETLVGFNVEQDPYAGRLANILVNAQHALNLLDQFTSDEDGGIAILDFLQALISDITTALGGVNNIEVSIDNDGLVKFVDKTPQTYQFNTNTSGSADSVTTFNAFGVQRDVRGSFVRDINLNSELSPDFASMIAIGAQANGNQISSNSTSFSLYNSGLQDRIIKEKFNTVNGINTNALDTLDSLFEDMIFPMQAVYQNKQFTSANITTLQSAASRFFNYIVGDLTNKESITPAFFLPFNFSVTVDGISGVKLFQKFKLTNNVLPPSYTEDNVDLIIKEINHEVSPSGWTTQIGTLSSPSPVNITGELYKPPPKLFPASIEIEGEVITGNAGAAQPIDIEPLTAAGLPTPVGALYWFNDVDLNKASRFNKFNRIMYIDYGITNPYARGAILAGIFKENKLVNKVETDYSNTDDNDYIRRLFSRTLSDYTLEQVNTLKQDPVKFFSTVYANTDLNGPPESGDGYKYRGRAYVQTTHRRQYKAAAERTGRPELLNNPDLLLTDEALAIQVAIVTFLNSYLLKGSINDVSSIQEACNLIGCIIAGRATGTRASNGVANTLAQFTSKFRVFIDSGGQGTEFNSDQGPDLNYIGGVNGGGAS